MRDRKLEKNIARLESLINRWKELSQLLDRGFQQQGVEPKEEAAFLELKSSVARDYELMMTTLGSMADRDNRVLRLLNMAVSLQALGALEEGVDKKIVGDWHSAFLGMQALLGKLLGRQATLAGISSFRMALLRVTGNPLVVVAITAAACYGVYRFIDDWLPQLTHFMEQTKQ